MLSFLLVLPTAVSMMLTFQPEVFNSLEQVFFISSWNRTRYTSCKTRIRKLMRYTSCHHHGDVDNLVLYLVYKIWLLIIGFQLICPPQSRCSTCLPRRYTFQSIWDEAGSKYCHTVYCPPKSYSVISKLPSLKSLVHFQDLMPLNTSLPAITTTASYATVHIVTTWRLHQWNERVVPVHLWLIQLCLTMLQM